MSVQVQEDDESTDDPQATGCARWIGDWPEFPTAREGESLSKAFERFEMRKSLALLRGRRCGRTTGLIDYQVGPLCSKHQPVPTDSSI